VGRRLRSVKIPTKWQKLIKPSLIIAGNRKVWYR
jgi:hypothetical protein